MSEFNSYYFGFMFVELMCLLVIVWQEIGPHRSI